MDTTALDTNIAIDLLNGNNDILHKYQKYATLYLPVTVCGELLYGAINSNNSKKNLVKYRGFISNCTILNINSAIAEQYAAIRKGLKEKGTPIPENDIWIAATAMQYKLLLFTHDKHFNEVEGISIL